MERDEVEMKQTLMVEKNINFHNIFTDNRL